MKQLFLSLCMLFVSFSVLAQSEITGIVKDPSGEAIIGASVLVKGTAMGTITDIDGNFTLNVSQNAVLVVSYIGYKTEEIATAGKTFLAITLKEDTEILDEVVVVGYGTQKKVNLTGAVSSVGQEVFADKGATVSPLANMQGAIAGVNITRSSSSPSRSGWDILVRGETSVNGTKPLVMIDGIAGNMDNINPDDIENISILKDASAAIYGARAAGGVVLVTTKRGAEHKTKINYKGNISMRTPGNVMSYMNMKNYMTTFEEAYINDGTAFDEKLNIYPRWVVNAYKLQHVVSDENSPLYTEGFKGMNTWSSHMQGDIHDYGFYDVDWNDVLWGTAVAHSHSLSVSGGNEKAAYNLSLGYTGDNSVLKWGDDNLKRYNIRLNNDYKLTERVKIATTLAFDRVDKGYPQRKPNDIGGQPAGSPIATDNGLPYAWGGQVGSHWQSKLGGEVGEVQDIFTGNLSATIGIIKDLNLVANAAVTSKNYNKRWYEKKIQWYYLDESENMINPSNNKVGQDHERRTYQSYNAYLEYTKNLGSHYLAAMGGVSYETDIMDRNEISVANTVNDIVISMNGRDDAQPNEKYEKWGLASYFGRLNYNYKGKYLVEVLGRYDGSSKFARGYRWKGFYGVSAGYRISEEEIVKNLNIFDNLKLRASYGTTGNQSGIDVYDGFQFLDIKAPSGQIPNQPIFGEDGSGSYIPTITEQKMVSNTRTWEIVTQSNIGLDFAVLNNRLSGTFEYYWKENDNMLVNIVYPAQMGIVAPETNNGTFRAHGWEVSLNWRDKIGDFNYSVGLNVSDGKNKLVAMDNAKYDGTGGFKQNIEGQPLNTYWGFKAKGLITTAEELEAYTDMTSKEKNPNSIVLHKLRIGDMMYEDTNGDGYVTAEDRVCLGEDTPHYSFGINLAADWKGFDLSLFFQGVGERTVMRTDHTRAPMLSWYMRQNNAWAGKQYSDIGEADYVVENKLQAYYNNVQKGSDLMPKLSANSTINEYNYHYSSAWYSKLDGKYLRLKNLTFGYTLPKQWLAKMHIDRLRVYFTGTDLFEISKIEDGWDPEAKRDAFGGTVGANAIPFTRSYTFGVDLTF